MNPLTWRSILEEAAKRRNLAAKRSEESVSNVSSYPGSSSESTSGSSKDARFKRGSKDASTVRVSDEPASAASRLFLHDKGPYKANEIPNTIKYSLQLTSISKLSLVFLFFGGIAFLRNRIPPRKPHVIHEDSRVSNTLINQQKIK